MGSAQPTLQAHRPNVFTVKDQKMILLHGFIKKSEKTAQSELRIARERKMRLEREL